MNNSALKLNFLSIIFLTLITSVAVAQPSISTVSTISGNPGATITISGSNFNTTATNNKVYFGATKATVTSASANTLTVTLPIGATYMPISVTDSTAGRTAYTKAFFTPTYNNSLLVPSSIGYGNRVTFTSGTNPNAVAFGDFDGDGKTDMAVVAQASTSTLSIFRNTSTSGSMSSSSFATKVDFSIANNSNGITIGDLDGDGRLDIVVNNQLSNSVSIFRNISTPGSFTTSSLASRIDLGVGSNPTSVAIGDVDGDGRPEIMASNSGANNISVLRNVSVPGTFNSASFSSAVNFTTGSSPRNIVLGDLNGDGKPEMIVTNQSSTTISVFTNTSTAGTISASSFAAKVDFTTGSSPVYVAVGDFDLDGKADLAVTNQGANTVSVFQNTHTTGSISTSSLAAKVDFTLGSSPLMLALGDLDGDGKLDIAAANAGTNTLSILRNTSTSGSITSGSFASKIDLTTASAPYGITIGDLDGDGYPDIAAAEISSSTTISVFRFTPVSQPPAITSVTPNAGNPGSTITISGTNFNATAANNKVFFGATSATVLSGTSTALVVTSPVGGTFDRISLLDSVGGLTGFEQYPYTPTYNNSSYLSGVINLGGKVDFTPGTNPQHVTFGDIDGDGKSDMVVVNYTSNTASVYRNISTTGSIAAGSFAAKVDFTTGTTPVNVVVKDIDGDGKQDMIVVSYNSAIVSIYRNIGSTGSITSGTFATKVDYATATGPWYVAVGDLDGDGKPDIAVANEQSNSMSIYRNLSTSGSLAFTTKSDYTTGTGCRVIAIGDLDGDGKQDLITSNYTGTSLSVFRNVSNTGVLSTSSFAARVDLTTGSNPWGVGIGDIDGDGKLDLATANYNSNTISLFRNTGSSGTISFSTKVDFTTPTQPHGLALGDMDGDGKVDIAVANAGSASASLFRNAATSGSITTSSLGGRVDLSAGNTPYNVSIADIDGDGKPDMVVTNYGSNTVSVYRNIPMSPPPTITAVNPNVGNPGTTVTITGTNFNTTAANNVVYFGATKATVSSASSTTLTVVSPIGATNERLSVTNVPNSAVGWQQYPFVPKFNNSAFPAGSLNYAPKVDFTSTGNSNGFAFGDVDGDGKTDMIVANTLGSGVSVFRNISTSGVIASNSFAAKVDFTTATGARGVSIVDMDGDGKLDIVVGNFNSNNVSILLNTATSGSITSGSFAAAVSYTVGTSPVNIVTGDFDGDGKADVAVVNNGSTTMSILRNLSSIGSISLAAKVDFTTGSAPTGIAAGDVDGDGKLDIAITNSSSATVSVFRNTSSIGSINSSSFAAKVDFTTGTSPTGVSIGDIDGDGKPDMMVGNSSSNTLSLFRNISTSGTVTTGSFEAKVDYATGTGANYTALGDLDGDGKVDVAVSNITSNTVSLFRNTTSVAGSFTSGSLATKVDLTTGNTPIMVWIGDLDGDGRPEVATTNYGGLSASILRGSSPPPTITSVNSNAAIPGSTITLTGYGFNTASAANNKVYFGATKATVTAVSATSLTVTSPLGGTYMPISVTDSTSGLSGVSKLPFIPTYNNAPFVPGSISYSNRVTFTSVVNPNSVAFGDFDGDGKTDMAVISQATTSTLSIYRNTSTSGSMSSSSFATKVDFSMPNNSNGIAIGDLDGDGRLDIVVNNQSSNSISIFRNTSTPGSFTTSSLATRFDIGVGSNPTSVAIGDVDGDGRPEIFVTNFSANTVSVIRNVSAPGTLTPSSFSSAVNFTTGTSPRDVVVGDLNGDGKAEMIVTNQGATTVSVFTNTSSMGGINASSFAAKVDFATGSSPVYVAVGDFDLDGKSDLAVTNQGANTVSVFSNTHTSGNISTGSFAAKVDFTVGSSPLMLAIGDLDGDGKPEIATANSGTTTLSILRNTSTSGSITSGSFANRLDLTVASNPYSIAIGDLDGDGYPDIAAAEINSSTTVSVIRNSPAQLPPAITSVSPNTGNPGTTITISGTNFNATPANNKVYFGATSATVISGSSTTLVVTSPVGGTFDRLTLLDSVAGLTAFEQYPYTPTFNNSSYLSGVINFGGKVDFSPGTNPQHVSFGDIDGDGKSDMAVVNYTSNTVSVYRNISTSGSIAAGSFAAKVDFTTGTTPVYVVIKDIDGDGKQDMIVVNYNSATVSIFRNIGSLGTISASTFATKVDFTTATGPWYATIGDLDGDGKPDMAVANEQSNSMSVYRNLCTPGNITVSTFTTKSDLATGNGPRVIAMGDMDGDGKQDLVTSNYSGTSLSVFRNIATTGNLGSTSFATRVDLTTGANPWGVGVGDIDGDGKLDIATANYNSNTVSLFRNTGSSGTISFSTKVDFTTPTQPHALSLGDLDGDGKVDLAVANAGSANVSVFRNTATSGSITTSSLGGRLDLNAGGTPYNVSIADIDGDGKPDMAVTNYGSNTVSIYLNNPMSQPPTITGVSPNVGNPGTTVTITGTNFNTTAANNVVYFGATKATVSAASATSLTVVSPIGATNERLSVINVPNSSAAWEQYSFLPKFDNSLFPAGAMNFNPKVDFAPTNNSYGFAFGDVDGDGKTDMVIANTLGSGVSVFRNISTTGTIASSSFAAKVDFATAAGARAVSIVDMDGDGKLDIVVGNINSNNVSVLLNTSTSGSVTSGSFAAAVSYAVGTSPVNIVTGDFDGDGKADVAVTNNGSTTMSILRNLSANGSISLAGKIDFTTGASPLGIAAGDIDGDGKLDIAVTNSSAATVSVFRNTSSIGSISSGSFAAKVDFTTGTSPSGVSIGDIDGDGKPDILVGNTSSNTLSLFRNIASSGSLTTGSLEAKVDYTTGTGANYIALGDLDGDGKVDIAVSNLTSNTVSLFRNANSAAGSFTSGSLAAKVDLVTGNSPNIVWIGDLDGDGRPEIATNNYNGLNASIMRGSNPPPTITAVSPNTAIPGSTITLTGYSFNTTAANNKVYFGATRATVTAASATTLTVTTPTGATYMPVTVTDSIAGLSGSAKLSFTPTYNNGSFVPGLINYASRTTFTSVVNPNSIAFGDFDGDGKTDMAVVSQATTSTLSIFRNTSTTGSMTSGSFAAKVDFTLGNNANGIAVADLDRDGKLDIVVNNQSSNTVSIFRNTATAGSITTSSLATRVDISVGANPTSVALGDVDGDGRPEILVTNSSANTVSVMRNISVQGAITTGSFSSSVTYATGTTPRDVVLGDINGDGKAEMIVTNQGANTISVFTNTSGAGSISIASFAAKVDFTTGTTPVYVAVGDFDRDGKSDLAVTNQGANTVSVFLNTHTSGNISTGSLAAKVDFAVGASPLMLAIGDVDGDSKPDIATANSGTTTLSILRNTSTTGSISSGSFATKTDFTTASSPYGIAIGDLDGDGLSDIAIAEINSSTTISVLRNAPPYLAPSITSVIPNKAKPGATVTLTGTNFNTTANNNKVYFGSIKATVSSATSTTLSVVVPFGALYGPVSVTDTVTGLSSASGQVSGYPLVSFMPVFDTMGFIIDTVNLKNKTDFIVTSLTGSKPVGAAIGDINGDGKADLVSANSDSSSVSIFLNASSGGTITAGSFNLYTKIVLAGKPNNVKLADIDGDGMLDIVAALTNSTSINIIRNTTINPSTPTFAARSSIAAGSVSSVAGIADFNGDGKLDIVLSLPTGVLAILKNTSVIGTISFASAVNATAGAVPLGIAVADYDGDGLADLATVNSGFTGSAYTGSTASVFRNTSTYNTISFATATTITTGSGPIDICTGDIDGDGKMDLVTSNFNDATFSAFRNTSSTGTISFTSGATFSAGVGVVGVNVADMTGDGRTDIVMSNAVTNSISVLRNTTTGTTFSFAPKVDRAAGSAPSTVTLGDLDGDGYTDVVAGNQGSNTISILENYPLPKIDTIAGVSSLCVGDSSTFTNSISGGTWRHTNATAAGLSATGAISALSAGIDTVFYTRIINGDTNFVKRVITINATPSITVTPVTSSVCSGSNTYITSSGAATYNWAPASSLSATTGTTVLSTPATSTTYTVSGTSAAGCTASNTQLITVISAPTAGTISGPSALCVGTTVTLIDTVSGGNWISSSTAIATISNSGILTGITNGTSTISYKVANACDTVFATYAVSVNTTQWVGTISGNWNTPVNWSCGIVPTVTDDILIPVAPFAPVIGTLASGSVKNIYIASLATVTVDSAAILNIKGNLQNSGRIIGKGRAILNNNLQQTITGKGTVVNLELNNSNGAKIDTASKLSVSGTLTVTFGTLITNDSLELASADTFNSSSTYAIIPGRIAAIPVSGASISGKVKVAQYVQGNYRRYRFWSHPFNASLSLSQVQQFIDITGKAGAANGFTTTASNAPSAFRLDPYTSNDTLGYDPGWKPYTKINSSAADSNMVRRYQGIRLFFRGAKGEGLGYTGYLGLYNPSPVTVKMFGNVNQGPQTAFMAQGAADPYHQSFNMMGNPYPSPIDIGQVLWRAAQTGNVQGSAFYVWDPTYGAGGNFITVPIGTATPVHYNIGANTCFQVRAGHDGDSLNFLESDKTTGINSYLFKMPVDYLTLNVYDSSYHIWDALNVQFNEKATESEDNKYDAVKQLNADFTFYSLSTERRKLAIDARPFEAETVIPLGISSSYKQRFIIRAENVAVPVGGTVYLHDKLLNKFTELTPGAEYAFTIEKERETQGDNRFELRLKSTAKTFDNDFHFTMTPNPATDDVGISFSTGRQEQVHVRIIDMSGVNVYSKDLGILQSGKVNISLHNLAAGIYVVEFTQGDKKNAQRLIKE